MLHCRCRQWLPASPCAFLSEQKDGKVLVCTRHEII